MLRAEEKAQLQNVMFPSGKLSPAITARTASEIARVADLSRATAARVLMVNETGIGGTFPFSGEKLSPVMTIYRAADFNAAAHIVNEIYAYQGAGHSVGIHASAERSDDLALHLGLTLPVARVIVNQAHCIATGGSFDNGLPFSLSMGCGTWGGNSFSDNLTYRKFLNITRIARPTPQNMPDESMLFADYFSHVTR